MVPSTTSNNIPVGDPLNKDYIGKGAIGLTTYDGVTNINGGHIAQYGFYPTWGDSTAESHTDGYLFIMYEDDC